MALDPNDPRCPECDGPVGSTSTYCMHCGATFDDETAESARTDAESASVRESSGAESDWGTTRGSAVGRSDRGTARESSSVESDQAGVGSQVATAAVGAVMATVLAFVVFLASLVPLQQFSLAAALVAWVAGAFVVARQRTVLGAVGTGLVFLAVPVFLFPLGLGVPKATEGLLTGDVGLFVEQLGVGLFGSLLTLPVTGPLAVAGYVMRRRAG